MVLLTRLLQMHMTWCAILDTYTQCIHTGRLWPLKLFWRCPNCKTEGSLCHQLAGVEKRVLITCEGNVSICEDLYIFIGIGRFDLDDCIAECQCCKYTYGDSLSDVINAGFWPSSAHSFNYLFSCQLLRLFDYVQKFVPGTSVNGFLSALEEISAHNGRAIRTVYTYTTVINSMGYYRFPPSIDLPS